VAEPAVDYHRQPWNGLRQARPRVPHRDRAVPAYFCWQKGSSCSYRPRLRLSQLRRVMPGPAHGVLVPERDV